MKVLVSFETRVRPDSTGFYYLQAFRQLGHEVHHCLPEGVFGLKEKYDLYVKIDDGIKSNWNKDLHPSVYQVIDTHIESDWRVELATKGEFDLVAVAQKEGLKLPWTNNKVIWGPMGCDFNFHSVGDCEKKYDVAVIMNFHSQYAEGRIRTAHDLMAAVPNFFFGSRTYLDMAKKFAESKLVFNKSLNKDLNMRFFEGMASGSCLLTDRLDEMKELGFEDGVHYAGYSSNVEMVEVAKALLKDSVKREEIAKNGHREALKHTYAERTAKILKELGV